MLHGLLSSNNRIDHSVQRDPSAGINEVNPRPQFLRKFSDGKSNHTCVGKKVFVGEQEVSVGRGGGEWIARNGKGE